MGDVMKEFADEIRAEDLFNHVNSIMKSTGANVEKACEMLMVSVDEYEKASKFMEGLKIA